MSMSIQEAIEVLGTPTLKSIAGVFDLTAVRLYAVAKQPIPGQTYDPNVKNWDAISKFVERRFDEEKNIGSFEAVITRALELDAEAALTSRRRGRAPGEKGNYGYQKKVVIDGVETVALRYDYMSAESEVKKPIVLKDDAHMYSIVYQTVTNTVLRPIDAEGNVVGHDLRMLGNFMYNTKIVTDAAYAEELESRKDGTFAIKLAEKLANAKIKRGAKVAKDEQEQEEATAE